MSDLAIISCAVVVNAVCHATRDTLHHHWHRSIFARFGELSFFGPADMVWLRRYVNNDPTQERKWSPMWDGVMDAWHLAESLKYGVWILASGGLAGLSWYWMIGLWAVGQAVFSLLYDKWYLI